MESRLVSLDQLSAPAPVVGLRESSSMDGVNGTTRELFQGLHNSEPIAFSAGAGQPLASYRF